jgi:FkbH-like protein
LNIEMTNLDWLPSEPDRLGAIRGLPGTRDVWDNAVAIARTRLDPIATNALDRMLARVPLTGAPPARRVLIVGTATTAHLHAAIRVGCVRRGMRVLIRETPLGLWHQPTTDGPSPEAVLFALDAHHLAAGLTAAMDATSAMAEQTRVVVRVRALWRSARARFGCPVLHQMPLPLHPLLLEGAEHRLHGSKAAFVTRLSLALREAADADGVDILGLDQAVLDNGLAVWHDLALWHHAKQEIAPAAAPLYGDLVARWLAAIAGKSAKCLVLDLDNTLWGGVIGDDGLGGIEIGQGSAVGEAHLALQAYAKSLSQRGVILAVCSKNDQAVALEPFQAHPDMLLRQPDIACFVANWGDKPNNLRAIAQALNIGLDSLVFVDDNPFERALVRRALPMVMVPEIGDDPSRFVPILAAAGYFEATTITAEDRARADLYRGNAERDALRASATDLDAYLRDLDMRLIVRPFDRTGLPRIVQLINKSNQFNLTTKRYTEPMAEAVIEDRDAFGLQLRLLDRFGDNGVIAIVIGRRENGTTIKIDTWLMSCRVLGRGVEQATLAAIVSQAREMGAIRLMGAFIPSDRNAMVRGHYASLGFSVAPEDSRGGHEAELTLDGWVPAPTHIRQMEVEHA